LLILQDIDAQDHAFLCIYSYANDRLLAVAPSVGRVTTDYFHCSSSLQPSLAQISCPLPCFLDIRIDRHVIQRASQRRQEVLYAPLADPQQIEQHRCPLEPV
jgi:hypothetical protein